MCKLIVNIQFNLALPNLHFVLVFGGYFLHDQIGEKSDKVGGACGEN